MGNWNIFWDGLAIVAAIGVISAIFSKKINQVLEKVEYYASGHVTEHHKYDPFD